MRLRVLGIAAFVLPVALHAQQQQSPDSRIVQTFLAFGRPYPSWLLAAFDSVPASQYDYKPTPTQQSIGYIAQHLEDANYGLCSLVGNAKHVTTAKDSLADTVKARWPKDTLVRRVRESLVFCGEVLNKLSDASLTDELTVGPTGAQRTALRVRYLLLLVTDLAEHYSQLSSYMRILGMVPPSALPQPGR
jgi:DinB superfamily